MFKSNRYLIIASTIGVLSIVCLMLLYRQLAYSFLVAHESSSNVAITEVISKVVWTGNQYLVDTGSIAGQKGGVDQAAIRQLDAEVRRLMRGSKLVKVKIYNLDGLTIFSTDASQINEDKSRNAGFLSAKSGNAASNITFRDHFDSFEGLKSNISVVSSYIPIGGSSPREPEAVFEVYSDVTEWTHQIQRLQWQILIGVLGSVAILHLLLITSALRVDRIEAARLEEAAQSEAKIRYQASHDGLTGLINRHEFENRAQTLIKATLNTDDEHALCFMDLDQFKVVNDTCGHIAGDELLRQLSQVLNSSVRDNDSLARLGGDEFGVLLKSCTQKQSLIAVSHLQQAVQDFHFSWEGQIFRVGISIGLVAITRTTPDLVELLRNADAACYMAKDMGRNCIQVYRDGDTEISMRHGEMKWVSRINLALEENRFRLYAQKIVPLDNSSDNHYELLIRMLDENGKSIMPDGFLSAAERYSLIDKLDRWTITNGVELLAANSDFVHQVGFVSINLSGQSITNESFLESVIACVKDYGIDASKICFEITETSAISNLRAATNFIAKMKLMGCRFALDDFGSGMSSFGYLKNLQVDYLKIDGMFVKNIVEDPIDRAMVKSINDIGHVMGMKTIAEFVENDEIRSMLGEMGVDYAQGYGIGVPQPFDQVLAGYKRLKVS